MKLVLIKTVIVDDEIPVRDELEYLLTCNSNDFVIIGKGQTGEEAIKLCKELKPDVIFLDIHMYSMKGIEAAKYIMNQDSPPIIVFQTAYQEYAVKAFEINAVDYILKPLSEARINLTIKKIKEQINRESNNKNLLNAIYNIEKELGIKSKIGFWCNNGKYIFMYQRDIIYIEAQRKHTFVFTKDKKYESKTPFGEFKQKLDKNIFMKIHRSFMVNLEHVKEVGVWFSNHLCVVMKGYEHIKIPISKNNLKKFKQQIGMD